MSNSKKIPENFLLILQQEGISLKGEGVGDMALRPEAALRAIAILRTSRIGSVGGEVWEKVDDRFKPTYDGWNVEKEDYPNLDAYIDESLDIAENVVRMYFSRGENFFITLGF